MANDKPKPVPPPQPPPKPHPPQKEGPVHERIEKGTPKGPMPPKR